MLDWMRSFGVAPDTITFNTLMDVCAKAALSGRAKARHGQKVLGMMEVRARKHAFVCFRMPGVSIFSLLFSFAGLVHFFSPELFEQFWAVPFVLYLARV